jgi:hypothetical protein
MDIEGSCGYYGRGLLHFLTLLNPFLTQITIYSLPVILIIYYRTVYVKLGNINLFPAAYLVCIFT